MGIAIEIGLPGQTEADVLALPVAEPPESLGGEGARIVDEKLGGRLTRLARRGEEFTGSLAADRGTLVVYAKYAAGADYEGLLRYEGR